MQRMIPHADPLPACSAGHAARHMVDLRAAHAGGGHFIECACRKTVRHAAFDQALGDWRQANGITATPDRAQVIRLRTARAKGGAP